VVTYKDVRSDIAQWLRENSKFTVDSDGASGGCISGLLEKYDGATWSVVINVMLHISGNNGQRFGSQYLHMLMPKLL
jgi:hypothetical protein